MPDAARKTLEKLEQMGEKITVGGLYWQLSKHLRRLLDQNEKMRKVGARLEIHHPKHGPKVKYMMDCIAELQDDRDALVAWARARSGKYYYPAEPKTLEDNDRAVKTYQALSEELKELIDAR